MDKSETTQIMLNKIDTEIDNLRKKRMEFAAKIARLQRQKEKILNGEMLQMVKTIACDPNELKSILSALQSNNLDKLRDLVEKKGNTVVQEPPNEI